MFTSLGPYMRANEATMRTVYELQLTYFIDLVSQTLDTNHSTSAMLQSRLVEISYSYMIT